VRVEYALCCNDAAVGENVLVISVDVLMIPLGLCHVFLDILAVLQKTPSCSHMSEKHLFVPF